ncbi:MAG: thioesterase family protein [Chloroflexi bacterium]|nr:thioesterase family protein [Chloroflexota bacterium]MDA1145410.1 thioesterase family protein [Chloroflexota bacterium]
MSDANLSEQPPLAAQSDTADPLSASATADLDAARPTEQPAPPAPDTLSEDTPAPEASTPPADELSTSAAAEPSAPPTPESAAVLAIESDDPPPAEAEASAAVESDTPEAAEPSADAADITSEDTASTEDGSTAEGDAELLVTSITFAEAAKAIPGEAAAFVPYGDALLPTPYAASAWGTDVLHGGPIAALVARAAERAVATSRAAEGTGSGSDLLPARITIDLFRAVPRTALHTQVELIREGRRVVVARVSVLAGNLEVTRAQVLFLRRSEGPETNPIAPPPGPEGLETALGLSRGAPLPPGRSGGFHTLVETRWPELPDAPRGSLAWIRVPFPIVAGEEPTPFQRLAAVSDFGNALANYAADWQDPDQRANASFINTDISVHLLRPPEGEWLALRADRSTHANGVGLVEVSHFDHLGHYARSTQARLLNPK